MAFRDYSLTPASNTLLADGTYVGPNMLRNKVRPAIQQIMADGRGLYDEFTTQLATYSPTVTSASGQSVTTRGTLAGIASPTNGQTAYLTEDRVEGWFEFSTANLSASVTADPYQALYVAPTTAPTGASGAWVRIIANNIYHVEWWLPAAMPTNAQVQLNSMDALIPNNAVLLMPARQVNVTGEWVVRTPGITVWGNGRSCPVYGNSGAEATQVIVCAGDNQTWHNVWSGGTYGTTPGESECPAWHIYPGTTLERAEGFHAVENVRLLDCGAINAMVGFRVGYAYEAGVGNHRSKNCRVEGFTAENIYLLGFEVFATTQTNIIEPIIKMGTRYLALAQYAARMIDNKDLKINGGNLTGLDETTDSVGLWLTLGDNAASGFTANRDTLIQGVNLENFGHPVFIDGHEGACELVNISYSGRGDTDIAFLTATVAGLTLGENEVLENLVVRGGVVHNCARYAKIGGDVRWCSIRGVTFVSNNHANTEAILFEGYTTENFTGEVIGNRFVNKQRNSPPFRFGGTYDALFDIQIDDNDVIPSSSATTHFWERYGPATGMTIRTKHPNSNRALASTRWTAERPALDLEDWT